MTFYWNDRLDRPPLKRHSWAIIRTSDRALLATFEDFDVAVGKLDIHGEPGTVEVVAKGRAA